MHAGKKKTLGVKAPLTFCSFDFLIMQEMEQMKSRIARDEVNVEVDSATGPELGTILADLRTQYEGIVNKNKEQAEQWYHKKV